MKKMVFLFMFFTVLSGAIFAQVKAGDAAWVSAKTAPVKSSTWFFAGTNGTLNMGAQVSVIKISGNWAEVRSAANASLSGWVSISNLSSRRVIATSAAVTASEVAQAGKGFSQEVENSYKTSGQYNFADVDKTEANTVSQNDLYRFVVDGKLYTGEEK